ncbi:hypothetical protein [Argonema antarcticum]|uniref:hypothetical protein n=1 Tax=Argonema antarcticum TaxID=2942763 RepID=UPI0020126F9A|nr:hypothetical protein [Argonema antarcticum]MCL1470775.1 hypothetical protein [Argonema antarcticum A004/B2]
MLPTLAEFGAQFPVFIRKIDSRARWNPEGCNSIEERANRVAERLFTKDVYSIWRVTSDLEFYGVIASLSATRNPRNQDIDFIWITEEELQEVGITIEKKIEGDCLYVQKLHFNTRIDNDTAKRLCYNLLTKGREANRCKKNQTIQILEYQEKRGCKAVKSNLIQCECETMMVIN